MALNEAQVFGPATYSTVGSANNAKANYLASREKTVRKYFDKAMGVDEFISRVEMELCKFGFNGENSIAVLNLCRDEICNSLKHHVESVFGPPFNIHGLGGVLTCGVTGMGAGLSHAPKPNPGSRHKYVFFSFPHIAVNAAGEVGEISRADCHNSHACGAMLKVLGQVKKEDAEGKFGKEVKFDNLDPEYSVLKARMDKKILKSGYKVKELDLASLTSLGEQAITEDLEELISRSVDMSKADYAVITGVQIHNWANSFEDEEPNFEFVQPCSAYVVVNGKKTALDLPSVQGLTPRMLSILLASKL